MKFEERGALLVIDIQQKDVKEITADHMDNPMRDCIRNSKRVPDVFRAKNCL